MSGDTQLIQLEYLHSEFLKIHSVEIKHYGDTWRTTYGAIRIKHWQNQFIKCIAHNVVKCKAGRKLLETGETFGQYIKSIYHKRGGNGICHP